MKRTPVPARILMKLVSSLALTLFLLPACSGTPAPSPAADAGGDGAGDAATDAPSVRDTGPADAPQVVDSRDAPSSCNALVNSAAAITIEQVATDPPVAQGGAVVDGTYAMTAAVIYTGPAGPSGPSGTTQTTLQIAGTTIQVASTGEPATRTVTFTVSGTSIDSVDTCPDTDVRDGSYTATPTTFVVVLPAGTDDAGARTLVETFSKQ